MAASIEAYTSTVESDESDDDDSYNLPDFMPPARVIMNRNRNRRNDSSEATEMRIFRELFGTRLLVVENLWFLLDELSLHPEGGLPKHLLWALHFMKAYPLQAQGCAAVGGSGGAVDPKTYRKWVWAYIEAVSDLELEVVSLLSCVIYCILDRGLTSISSHPPYASVIDDADASGPGPVVCPTPSPSTSCVLTSPNPP
jgi:hypothetical protein